MVKLLVLWLGGCLVWQQFMYDINDVLYGVYGFECFWLQVVVEQWFELYDQVDCIDVVDVQVVVELGFGGDLGGFNFEVVGQDVDDVFEQFIFGYGNFWCCYDWWVVMNLLSVCMLEKW